MKEKMRESVRYVETKAAVILAVLILPLLASGQSLLLTNPPGGNAKISFRSFWSTNKSLEFPSAMFDLYFRVPLNSRTSIIGALPFLTLKQEGNYLGNAMAEAERHRRHFAGAAAGAEVDRKPHHQRDGRSLPSHHGSG